MYRNRQIYERSSTDKKTPLHASIKKKQFPTQKKLIHFQVPLIKPFMKQYLMERLFHKP